MKLLEILVDGVPASQGILQYRFEPGLNPWKQKGSFPLQTLIDIFHTLIYPLSHEKDPLGPGKCKRAGITFEARNTVFRLVRDFAGKKLSLSQLEPGGEDRFRELSHESRFIIETLNRSVKVPAKKHFRSFLICIPGKVDDQAPKSFEASISGSKPAHDDHARLKHLMHERETVEKAKTLEIEQDEVQQAIFKIDDDLRKLIEPREEFTRISSEYEPFLFFDKLGLNTSQVADKFKSFQAQDAKKGETFKDIESRYEQYNADLSKIPDKVYWKDPIFIGACVMALVSFIATSLYSKFWFLLFALALGTGGAVYSLDHRRKEKEAFLRKKMKGLDSEKASVEKKFNNEMAAIRKIQEAINLSDPEEILANMKRWDELREERKKIEVKLKTLESEISEEKLKSEREKLQARLSKIQSQLSDLPAVTMDLHSLDREISSIEQKLKGTSEPEMKVELSASPDPISNLLGSMAELVEKPIPELLQQTQKALDANIAAVTGRAYAGMNWSMSGAPQFRLPNGTQVNWYKVDPEMQAILKFAVQFTLWQFLSTVRPLPLWIDLLSSPAPERVAQIAISGAKHLAAKAQVIVLSS